MKLSTQLNLKQSQSLALTPQLVQSIKLLQLGNQELAEFVRSELEKNPLLELDPELPDHDRRANQSETGATAKPNDADQSEAGDTLTQISGELSVDAKRREADFDTSFENVYDADQPRTTGSSAGSTPSQSTGTQSQDPDASDFVSRVGEKDSILALLNTQIACAFRTETNREIAIHIAHSLDEDGYFRESMDETAAQLKVPVDRLEAVLVRMQQFEPTGIAARNLTECLALQLQEKNRFDPSMQTLLENLDLIAKREFSKLRKLCGVDKEDFSEMLQEIRALDPRPAAQYEPVLADPVIPDVFINRKSDGGWSIELNQDALPKVLVNRDYYSELKQHVGDEEAVTFLSECLEKANWLTRSLDQRAQTILKVATEIVRQQDGFFAEGVEHLKPMNLKTVAKAVKMHESTISRVTSNKFLMCERGLFELKYFFTASIGSSDGEESLSAESVRHKIRQLIDAESAKAVLSDDRIVEMLKETGIEIARRTVAKYRESMRIPSSVQRRREKQSHGNEY